jgi:hypothetical protein
MTDGSRLIAGGKSPGARAVRKYLVGAIPIVVLVLFLSYLWFVSGVLPVVERYPGREIKTEGYVKRAGFAEYRRQGHWVTYHANGQKASEGFYEAGEKLRPWRYWDEGGRELPAEPGGDDPVEP